MSLSGRRYFLGSLFITITEHNIPSRITQLTGTHKTRLHFGPMYSLTGLHRLLVMHIQRPDFHIWNQHQGQTCTPEKPTLYTFYCQTPTTYLVSAVSKNFDMYAKRNNLGMFVHFRFSTKPSKHAKKGYWAKKNYISFYNLFKIHCRLRER